jgi:hypothetical protein
MQLEAVGVNNPGAHMLLTFVRGIPSNPAGLNPGSGNRMGGTIAIEGVNGQPCNSAIYVY